MRRVITLRGVLTGILNVLREPIKGLILFRLLFLMDDKHDQDDRQGDNAAANQNWFGLRMRSIGLGHR